MKPRFTLFRRSGVYYCQDTETGKQQSLRTRDKAEARTLLHVKNEALRQPAINRQIARAYLTACDPLIATRTWQNVMEAIPTLKTGATRVRWETAIKSKAFDPIRNLKVLETRGEHFLRVLETTGVSINSYLRRIHGFALDMDWISWPVLPKKRWPAIKFKTRRAITWQEHQKTLAGEASPEWHTFYELLWHLGGSQTDVATLRAENIDWKPRIISFTPAARPAACPPFASVPLWKRSSAPGLKRGCSFPCSDCGSKPTAARPLFAVASAPSPRWSPFPARPTASSQTCPPRAPYRQAFGGPVH